MRVHKILEPVVVAAKALLQNAHHQDRPEIHPRPAGVAAAVRKNVLFQKREQLVPQRIVPVDRLNADRKHRGVVPRLRVQLDVLDGDRPQRATQVDDRPHAKSSEDSSETRPRGGNHRESYKIRRLLASEIRRFSQLIQRIEGFSCGH